MEVCRFATGVGTSRHGCMEVWTCTVDVATWRHGGMEVWRHGGMEVLSSGGAMRTDDVVTEAWSSGVCCGPADVEAWSSGGALRM